MELSVLEAELVDLLKERGPLTGFQLAQALRWGTAQLYPLLAQLEKSKVVRSKQDEVYPREHYYWVP